MSGILMSDIGAGSAGGSFDGRILAVVRPPSGRFSTRASGKNGDAAGGCPIDAAIASSSTCNTGDIVTPSALGAVILLSSGASWPWLVIGSAADLFSDALLDWFISERNGLSTAAERDDVTG